MKGDNMEKYKLVGTLNYFDIVPDILYPIFQDTEGNFYFAYSDIIDGEEEYTIKEFQPVGEDSIPRIKFLSNTNNTTESVEEYYGIGDIIVQAIEESEDNIYIGRIDKFTHRLGMLTDTLENIRDKELFHSYLEEYSKIPAEMDLKKRGQKNR